MEKNVKEFVPIFNIPYYSIKNNESVRNKRNAKKKKDTLRTQSKKL